MYGISDVLTSWDLDPLPTTGVLLTGLGYAAAWRRMKRPGRRGWPYRSAAAFGAGLLVLLIAIDGPPDVLSDTAFSAHMVQHGLMMFVAAPLLLLGAPVSLLLRADPPWLPRRVVAGALRSRAAYLISHPAVTFAVFTVVLVGSHLTPLYNLALQSKPVHQLEHTGYLMAALLFWWPAVGTDPGPHRPSHPARVLYLFLLMPVMGFLGVAIAGTEVILYPYYADNPPLWSASAIQDQHLAGNLMWISGMIFMPPALALVLFRWLADEDRDQTRSATTSRATATALAGTTLPATPAL